MNRRDYLGLVAGGTVALAGCSSILGSGEYQGVDKEALLLESVGEDWPNQNLVADHDYRDEFDRVWKTPDESLLILFRARIFDTVEAAENQFQDLESVGPYPTDYSLADEGVTYDWGRSVRCIFRDSNAIGMAVSSDQSGFGTKADEKRATTYAELMYQIWPKN